HRHHHRPAAAAAAGRRRQRKQLMSRAPRRSATLALILALSVPGAQACAGNRPPGTIGAGGQRHGKGKGEVAVRLGQVERRQRLRALELDAPLSDGAPVVCATGGSAAATFATTTANSATSRFRSTP